MAAAKEAMVIPVKSFVEGDRDISPLALAEKLRLVLLVALLASKSSAFLSQRACMNVTISVVNLQ